MSQILFGDDVRFKNGIVYPIQATDSTTYNITNTSGPDGGHDYAIVFTSTSAITVNLPDNTEGLEDGRVYNIIDGSGDRTNPITINAATGTTINKDGGTPSSTIIGGAYNSLELLYINITSDWRIV